MWHPDPLRREFLRAGGARVVLPIRPGFERAFSRLMSTGRLDGDGSPDPEDPPYMSIAQEIEAYARTNYPGNPAGESRHRRPGPAAADGEPAARLA